MTEPGPEPAFEPPVRAEPAPPPVQTEEAPRRRSTVREPAMVRSDEPPAPTESYRQPEPQPASNEGTDSDEGQLSPERPRRSGWWQRR
jgi:ribonuclease E